MTAHRPLPFAPHARATTLGSDGYDDPLTDAAGTRGRPGLVRSGWCRARGTLHGRSDAPHEPTLRRGTRHDPQPRRRGGSGSGDLPQGLPEVPPVPARHQHQGLALPDPHQHLHHQLPQGTALAQARLQRHRRRLAAGRRRLPLGGRPQIRGSRGARGAALRSAARRPRFALRGTPDGCPHG